MEKRSSMKDSGLSSLFRATEAGKPGDEEVPAATDDQAEVAAQPEDQTGAESTDSQAVDSPWDMPSHPAAGRRTLIQPSRSFPAVIRVVGVGGAGTNAINRMLEAGLEGVEFIAINTDAQALNMCEADHKLRIGRELTKGLGGGSDPKVGREAAAAAYDEIKAVLKGSDMVFITAGEGGGTGTGAAPVVAEIAKSLGALTIGVVSRPFVFEGKRRGLQALEGVRVLRSKADTVIVVPNDKLLEVADRGTSMVAALRLADDVLRQGVQGICDLVTVPGLINLDLGRRAHDHDRGGDGPHGDRPGPRRAARSESGGDGDQLLFAGDVYRGRAGNTAEHQRGKGPVAARGQRGGGDRQRGCRS